MCCQGRPTNEAFHEVRTEPNVPWCEKIAQDESGKSSFGHECRRVPVRHFHFQMTIPESLTAQVSSRILQPIVEVNALRLTDRGCLLTESDNH